MQYEIERKRSFLERTEDYLRSYGGITTAIGFTAAAPIGFTAGFVGSLLSDGGNFLYSSSSYIIHNFPNYSMSESFSSIANFAYSSAGRAIVSGLKDGFVAGLGGIVVSRWIKRKLLG